MADLRDNFCVSLDHTSTGVGGTLQQLEQLLLAHDPPLHHHLIEELGLVPQMFALRWITVLFSQEFHLPDVRGPPLPSLYYRNTIPPFLHCIIVTLYPGTHTLGRNPRPT